MLVSALEKSIKRLLNQALFFPESRSPSQEARKVLATASASSSVGLPRILRSSFSRMFVRSRSKTADSSGGGGGSGGSSDPLATTLSESENRQDMHNKDDFSIMFFGNPAGPLFN